MPELIVTYNQGFSPKNMNYGLRKNLVALRVGNKK